MNLVDIHRPKGFDRFVGSTFVVTLLERLIDSGKLPNFMLFTGPKGVGKTTACRIINAELNGGDFDQFSYIEIDAASNNSVDDIRSLKEMVKYQHSGKWRVVVLDEVHSLSTSAFNALLKMLEEPPVNTVFIMVTTRPESIPDTVKSRAMHFRFTSISKEDITRRLAEITIGENLPIVDANVLLRIAEVSDGSLRGAINLLELVCLCPEPSVEDVNQLTGNTVDLTDFMYTMLAGDLYAFEAVVRSALFQSNDIDQLLNNFISELKRFHSSGDISNRQFMSCMEMIWGMRKVRTSSYDLSRSYFEAGMYAMFSQNFWDGEESRGGEAVSGDRLATKDDMQALTQ